MEVVNENVLPSRFRDDYKVIKLLGRGGFGNVYKVKCNNGNICAVKEIDLTSKKMFMNDL